MPRFRVLATDYDGTLAVAGRVAASAQAALERLRASQRSLILVTGRELGDLRRVCDCLGLFERVVAENGALLFDPARERVVELAPSPPAAVLVALHRRGVPFTTGHSIIATFEEHEAAAVAAIREVGVEMSIALNRGSLMLLPAGQDKSSGLASALKEVHLSADQTVGIGDGENDLPFLELCAISVAVSSAVPSLLEKADWVTPGGAGEGVEQLAERLLADDLAGLVGRISRFSV